MLMRKMLRKAILNMKCQHAKMLCLSLYCLLSTGCGKKIQNPNQKEESDKLPLFSSTYDIKAKLFRDGDSLMGRLTLPNNAWVTIPDRLKVLQGNGGNQKARLYFNVKNDVYEFFCEYKGGADNKHPIDEEEFARGKEYILLGCYQDVDFDGILDSLNYSAGTETPHDSGNDVVLEVLGADDRSDNETQANIDVEFL